MAELAKYRWEDMPRERQQLILERLPATAQLLDPVASTVSPIMRSPANSNSTSVCAA